MRRLGFVGFGMKLRQKTIGFFVTIQGARITGCGRRPQRLAMALVEKVIVIVFVNVVVVVISLNFVVVIVVRLTNDSRRKYFVVRKDAEWGARFGVQKINTVRIEGEVKRTLKT